MQSTKKVFGGLGLMFAGLVSIIASTAIIHDHILSLCGLILMLVGFIMVATAIPVVKCSNSRLYEQLDRIEAELKTKRKGD